MRRHPGHPAGHGEVEEDVLLVDGLAGGHPPLGGGVVPPQLVPVRDGVAAHLEMVMVMVMVEGMML